MLLELEELEFTSPPQSKRPTKLYPPTTETGEDLSTEVLSPNLVPLPQDHAEPSAFLA